VAKRPKTRLPLDLGDLTIRRILLSDAPDLLEYLANPEVARYQYREPLTAEAVAELLDHQSQVRTGDPGPPLVLAAVFEGKVVGDVQLTITIPEHGQGEVGFSFNPRYGGRGLATRSLAATLGFGFIQLGLHSVTAATFVENERAWWLMERVGIRREAHFIHDGFVRGRWVDVFSYAMLADEWGGHHPKLVASVSLEGRTS
jgi:RimJ/RimL family protein N-acetyltransferase